MTNFLPPKPQCKKVYYTSKKQAKHALKNRRNIGIKSVYKCLHCDGWHLTKWIKKHTDIVKEKSRKKEERENGRG